MFALAILIGIYSYLIFAIGMIGFLHKWPIFILTILFVIGSIIYFKKKPEDIPRFQLRNRKFKALLFLFGFLAAVNLVGALAPELSFDALWYHLTLPKIFLQEGMIFPVTEGIFYYSVMPKLGEMLFTPFVAFNAEVFAKLTQWAFGILTSIVVYRISRRYLDEKKSFFAVLIFYSSIVVAWESTVAYVDLIRAFFEAVALWGFLVWYETREKKILIESAIFIGLAISTKLLALGSIPIFFILFLIFEKDKILGFKNGLIFTTIALLTALPWFLFSFIATGNPIFPIFSESFSEAGALSLLNPINLSRDLFVLFVKEADPISPLYIIFLPLVFVFYKKLNKELKIITAYSILALVVWYLIPRMGGGRFILAYLPAMSFLCVWVITQFKNDLIKKYSYFLIIFIFITTIFYRGIANSRYVPVILGLESKDKFLTQNLNFKFGDFYDTDGFLEKKIKDDDRALLFGFHNLYYANFPFVHSSYVEKGDEFNYIITQDSDLPERFSHWELIYTNPITGIDVYTLGEQMWHY